jgi:hypothetical protein
MQVAGAAGRGGPVPGHRPAGPPAGWAGAQEGLGGGPR